MKLIRKSSRVKIADAGLVSMLEDLHDQTGKVLDTAKRMRTQNSSGSSSTPSRSITPGNSQSSSASSSPGSSRSETTSTYRTPDEAKKDNAIPVTVSEADQLAIRNGRKNLGSVELKPSNTRAYLAVKDDVLVPIGREVPPLKQFYDVFVREGAALKCRGDSNP